jgi:RNA polymerase sigma-70 factor (ECF subfamily)
LEIAQIHTEPSAPAAPCPAGERLDFDAVYEEYFAFAWRTARRMGVPEHAAEDVVQNAFLILHRRLKDYDGRTPVRAWLLGIVAHVVADARRTYLRKDSRCVPHEGDRDGAEMAASPGATPLEKAEQAEALALVVSLLEQLDPDKREVLVLAQLEELSVPEIAECLGLNVNTVYSRLRAARQAFDAAHARYRARVVADRSRAVRRMNASRTARGGSAG